MTPATETGEHVLCTLAKAVGELIVAKLPDESYRIVHFQHPNNGVFLLVVRHYRLIDYCISVLYFGKHEAKVCNSMDIYCVYSQYCCPSFPDELIDHIDWNHGLSMSLQYALGVLGS